MRKSIVSLETLFEVTDIFGKTMSIPDEQIPIYLELAGRMDRDEIAEFKTRLAGGENPRNIKMELGHAIVEIYHGEKAARAAEEHFKTVHQRREVPDEIEEVKVGGEKWNIVDLISELGLAATKSDARRLVEGGGVKWEGVKVEDVKAEVTLTKNGALLQVGKRHFRSVKS